MIKQSQRLQVSKSYENPGFQKIKQQMMKQPPIQIKNNLISQKSYKPSTPQQLAQNQEIRSTNQRPQSQGYIKPPIVSNQNRISEKIPPKKQDTQLNLKKSIKNENLNLKEVTFGRGQQIDFNQQSFTKSFNKFTNGALLQSMKLSKEQIEENNDFLNREMKEQDSEEEDEFENEYQIKRNTNVEKKPIFQENQYIQQDGPFLKEKPVVEYSMQNIQVKQNTINNQPILKEKLNIEYNKPPLKIKQSIDNNRTLQKENKNIENNKNLSQQLNQQKNSNIKNKQNAYISITNQSKPLQKTINNQKQQSIVNRPQSSKLLNNIVDHKQSIINRPQSGKQLSNPIISPQINNQNKSTLKRTMSSQYVNNQIPSSQINYQKQSSIKRSSSGKQDKPVASVAIKTNIAKQQSSQFQKPAQYKKF